MKDRVNCEWRDCPFPGTYRVKYAQGLPVNLCGEHVRNDRSVSGWLSSVSRGDEYEKLERQERLQRLVQK